MQTASSLTFSSYLVKDEGRQPETKKKSISSRAFSHARGHFRVSRVSLNGLRKREIARSLRFKPDVKHFSTGAKILKCSGSETFGGKHFYS